MASYKKFEGNIINPPHKKLNWLNRNFYYIATLAIIGVLCLCYFMFKTQLDNLVASNVQWNLLLKPLRNANIGDLVGNIIFFFIISLFLERHFGTFKYFLIVAISFIPSSLATFAFTGSWAGVGFQGVAYFLAGILVITMLFNLKGYFFGRCRWVFSIIILVLTVLIMCWSGSSTWPKISIGFGLFTNLLNNWHACAFGGIMGLFAYLFAFPKRKRILPVLKSHKKVVPVKDKKKFK